MKRKLLSLTLALALCLGLTAVPAMAVANPYTGVSGNRFSDVLDKVTKTFTGYSNRKEDNTIYYLAPNATVRISKSAEKIGYLQINDDKISSLRQTDSLGLTEKTYTRDELEKAFGYYDLYCLITPIDSQNKEYDYLYFLFDDSAATNAANYTLNGSWLERYRGSGGDMIIPDGVTKIQGRFMDISVAPNVTSLTLPSSVREIESWTFTNCTGLSSVDLPNGLQKLGDGAFSGCSRLSSVTIPGSLTEIGTAVFADCGLNRVMLQSGLTSIGNSMFSGCQRLVAITIPASVTQVGTRAFAGCTSLTSVIFENGNTKIGEDAFAQSSIAGLLYQGTPLTLSAPAGGAVEAYCKANNIAFRAIEGATTSTPSTPSTPTVTVEDIPASGTAVASTQTVTLDGKKVEFQMYALLDENGYPANYIKLRDMAYVLKDTQAQFSVDFDGTIYLATGQPYLSNGSEMSTPFSGNRAYKGGAQTVKVNGTDVAMTAITLTDDNGGGYTYFKLRDLGKVLGFNVTWNDGVIVESDKPYVG